MKVFAQIPINANKTAVWNAITDIEHATDFISGIEEVKILENPEIEFVGFKWQETRVMFGKKATEIMWITEAVTDQYYKTRAESHGSIYESVISLIENNGITQIKMEFEGSPQTFGAKAMNVLMGWMFKGATQKALQKDLKDIKVYVESR